MIRLLLETDTFIPKPMILMALFATIQMRKKKKKSWMDQIWKAANKEESVGLKIYVQKGFMGVVICTWNKRKRNRLETHCFTEEIIQLKETQICTIKALVQSLKQHLLSIMWEVVWGSCLPINEANTPITSDTAIEDIEQ